MRIRRTSAIAAAALFVLVGCTGAPTPATPTPGAATPAAYQPVSITNCDVKVDITAAPKAAVTLNQGATEVMLALGLKDRMVGTAYLDDQVPAKWKASYDQVKVLAKEYPSKEAFLAAKPDFSYASYASAFTEKAVGTRAELKSEGINTYLSPFGCPKGVAKAPGTMESAWAEVTQIASIFGVKDRADALIKEQQDVLAKLKQQGAGKGKRVFWYDSGDKELYAGAGKGGPQIILDSVGAKNIFANLDGGWASASWEKVVEADPDVIVFADASWSSAKGKVAYLEADPVLSKLKAVQAKAYIIVAFSESTPGIRLVDGATAVAAQLAKLK